MQTLSAPLGAEGDVLNIFHTDIHLVSSFVAYLNCQASHQLASGLKSSSPPRSDSPWPESSPVFPTFGGQLQEFASVSALIHTTDHTILNGEVICRLIWIDKSWVKVFTEVKTSYAFRIWNYKNIFYQLNISLKSGQVKQVLHPGICV